MTIKPVLDLVKLTRPIIAIIVAITLCGLAIGKATGQAPGVPDWYLAAFLAGGITDVLGWQISREIAKKKGAQ